MTSIMEQRDVRKNFLHVSNPWISVISIASSTGVKSIDRSINEVVQKRAISERENLSGHSRARQQTVTERKKKKINSKELSRRRKNDGGRGEERNLPAGGFFFRKDSKKKKSKSAIFLFRDFPQTISSERKRLVFLPLLILFFLLKISNRWFHCGRWTWIIEIN